MITHTMKYSLDSNIEMQILEKLNDLAVENGHQPDYIILGSKEYFELTAVLTEKSGFKHFGPAWVDSYHGLSIIVSTADGVSFGFKDNKNGPQDLKLRNI